MALINHQRNTKLFDNVTVTGNVSSDPIEINGYSLYCVQHRWSGATGNWSIIIEGSNVEGTKTDADYTVIDSTNVTGANLPAGNRMVNVEKAGYAFVRARIVFTSGGGTLNYSILNGKVW